MENYTGASGAPGRLFIMENFPFLATARGAAEAAPLTATSCDLSAGSEVDRGAMRAPDLLPLAENFLFCDSEPPGFADTPGVLTLLLTAEDE